MFSFSDISIFVRNIFLTGDICFHRFYIIYFTTFRGFFISSSILLYTLNTLFTEKKSCEQYTRRLKPSIVSNLSFPSNSILSCFLLFFLIIDLYSLIPAVIAQIFIPTVELAIPTGTSTNEAKVDIETQSLTPKTKTKKCSK